MPTLAQQIVLGISFLRGMNPAIDWKQYTVMFEKGKSVQLVPVAPDDSRPSLHEISAKTAVRLAKQQGSVAWFTLIRGSENIQTGLLVFANGSGKPLVAASPEFQMLVDQYRDVFTDPREPAPGQVAHRIDRHDESLTLPKQRAYRMSPAKVAEARRQIDSILEKGQIRPSSSPYGAPLLFVQKKTRELRMYIDYHLLNKKTRLERFLIPRIDYLLDKLANTTVFSKIDLSNAYHQVPIKDGHQFKTVF